MATTTTTTAHKPSWADVAKGIAGQQQVGSTQTSCSKLKSLAPKNTQTDNATSKLQRRRLTKPPESSSAIACAGGGGGKPPLEAHTSEIHLDLADFLGQESEDILNIVEENQDRIASIRYSRDFSEKTFLDILKRCPNLPSLDLSCYQTYLYKRFDSRNTPFGQYCRTDCGDYPTSHRYPFKAVIEFCPNLRELKIPAYDVESHVSRDRETSEGPWLCLLKEHVLKFVLAFPQLESLTLEGRYDELSEEDLLEITKNYPKLKSIAIYLNNNLTDRGVRAILNNCPNLKVFKIASCPKITDNTLKSLFRLGRNLEEVRISGFFDDLRGDIPQNFFRNLGELKLTHLSFNNCKSSKHFNENRMDLRFLDFLAPHCSNLTHFALTSFYGAARSESVDAFVKSCPKLESVNLERSFIQSQSIEELAKTHPHLKDLNLFRCIITDETLKAIGAHCHQLESFTMEGDQTTDEGMQALLINASHLKKLKISSHPKLTDETLRAIAECCDNLEDLELSGWNSLSAIPSNITDEGATRLLQQCSKLRSLNLSSHPKITNATVEAIAEYLPELEELHLSNCPNITDAIANPSIISLKRLKTLYLDRNDQITALFRRLISGHVPQMRQLNTSQLYSHYRTPATIKSDQEIFEQFQRENPLIKGF